MTNTMTRLVPGNSGLGASHRGFGRGVHLHRETPERESHPTWVRKSSLPQGVIHPLAWQASAIAAGSQEDSRLMVYRASAPYHAALTTFGFRYVVIDSLFPSTVKLDCLSSTLCRVVLNRNGTEIQSQNARLEDHAHGTECPYRHHTRTVIRRQIVRVV